MLIPRCTGYRITAPPLFRLVPYKPRCLPPGTKSPGKSDSVASGAAALAGSSVSPFNILSSALVEIWDYFHSTLLKKYASIYNGINVATGPVFDYNYDGQYDTPEQIQQ